MGNLHCSRAQCKEHKPWDGRIHLILNFCSISIAKITPQQPFGQRNCVSFHLDDLESVALERSHSKYNGKGWCIDDFGGLIAIGNVREGSHGRA